MRDERPRIRPLTPGDAEPLAALLAATRAFLAPFGPARDDEFFTVEGQRARLRVAEDERRADGTYRYAILDDDGDLAGAIALENVVRGGGPHPRTPAGRSRRAVRAVKLQPWSRRCTGRASGSRRTYAGGCAAVAGSPCWPPSPSGPSSSAVRSASWAP